MPRLTIDGREISVPAGATVLEAARALGIHIPTLCHAPGLPHQTSCLVCVVRIGNSPRLTASCGLPATEGMQVDASSAAVAEARRTAVELLLGDHEGECEAPCVAVCAAGVAIPTLMRQVESGDLGAAAATLKARLALPAVLTRLCGSACEKGCRRGVIARKQGGAAGQAVAIAAVERAVAEADLAAPWLPARLPDTGKHVAVVGSGPAGLGAAWVLAQAGHQVTVYESAAQVGGGLRQSGVPATVLDQEIAGLTALGIRLETGFLVADLDALLARHHAVVLALGGALAELAPTLGVAIPDAAGRAHGGGRPGVFVARHDGKRQAVRAAAEGRSAALAVNRFLLSGEAGASAKAWSMRRLPERPTAMTPVQAAERRSEASLAGELAAAEAARCLHCGCAKSDGCRLRSVSGALAATAHRFTGTAMTGAGDDSHRLITLEPGKCIACGLCVAWCEQAGLATGLAFIGRGPRLAVAMPLGHRLAELPDEDALRVAELCPSGALARTGTSAVRSPKSEVPIVGLRTPDSGPGQSA